MYISSEERQKIIDNNDISIIVDGTSMDITKTNSQNFTTK